jgi:cytochrome P450
VFLTYYLAEGVVRQLSSDVVYGDYVLPKGSSVQIPFLCVFRSGISDPEEFLPDRWDESAPEAGLLKELFMPFALGKRNCFGQNLAMLELRLVLSTLFRSFKFRLESDETVESEHFLTLKPVNVRLIAEEQAI